MKWNHIVPKKDRPKCAECSKISLWRCDLAWPDSSHGVGIQSEYVGICVCGQHKGRVAASETISLLRKLGDASQEVRVSMKRYIREECMYTFWNNSHWIVSEVEIRHEILDLILEAGADFALLPPKQISSSSKDFLAALELLSRAYSTDASATWKSVQIIGLLAKHYSKKSRMLLIKISKTSQVKEIRTLAEKLLPNCETSENSREFYSKGHNGAVVHPSRNAGGR